MPTPSTTQGQLLRMSEAAELIQVSRRFLEKEVKRGRLQVIRLSKRCVRVRPKDIEIYAESYISNGGGK